MRQPDGREIQVRIWGDEYSHTIESLDGYTLVLDPLDRAICYASLLADGTELISTGVRVGQGDPKALGLTPHLRIRDDVRIAQIIAARGEAERQDKIVAAKVDAFRQESAHKGKALPAYAPASIGNVKGLCLLVDFSDCPAWTLPSEVDRFLNQTGYAENGNNGSVRDYFYDVSGGKLTLTHYVPAAFYRAKYPKSYYEDPGYIPDRARDLVDEALSDLRAKGLNLSQYDSNHDGIVDSVSCLYPGSFRTDVRSGLWPHSNSTHYSGDGVLVMRYSIANIGDELTLAAFCHETGHTLLSWSDLYDMTMRSSGIGAYCLMAYGNFFKHNPTQPCAHLKALAGWATVIPLTAPQANLTVTAGSNQIYQYNNPNYPYEYYWIENRQQSGRDVNLPDSGLAVWHYDNRGYNNNPEMTESRHYLVTLVQADGRWDLEHSFNWGDAKDLFDAGSVSELYPGGVPDTNWWDGSPSGLDLSRIGPSGPTMSFTFGQPYALQATPRVPCVINGVLGGPFESTQYGYTLTNRGETPLNWTAAKTATWLSMSKAAGTLAPGASETIEISASSAARELPEGVYHGQVDFTDGRTGMGPRRTVTLNIPSYSFVWKELPPAQVADRPFSVRITAVDSKGTTVTQFNKTVRLSASAPGRSLEILPAVTGNFIDGDWSGMVKVANVATSVTLRASDDTFHSGQSSNFVVRHPLLISPASGFTSGGPAGGMFYPGSATYTLENQGTSPLTWTAQKSASWLDLSKTGGTLASGARETIQITINNSANSMAIGNTTDTLVFTDTIRGVQETRLVALAVRPISGFKFEPIDSPQTVHSPIPVKITAVDDQGTTATSYNGPASINAYKSAIVANYPLPDSTLINTQYCRSRMQVIYYAQEIGFSGPLNALWLNVCVAPATTMNNFTIRMRHTNSTVFYSSWFADGWTTVYRDNLTLHSSGWIKIPFSTPFIYDGTNNLMVEFSFNNESKGDVGRIFCSIYGGYRTIYNQTDEYNDPLLWITIPPPKITSMVPHIRFVSNIDVSPSNTGTFSLGSWAGSVTIGTEATSLALETFDNQNHYGQSNAFDMKAPFVRRVTSPHADGVFTVNQTIDIDVVFSAPVYLSGSPVLQLATGGAGRSAAFLGKIASNTLRFRYVVGPGDRSVDLDTMASSSLLLNGGQLTDAATREHNALLALPIPGAPDSLSANKNLAIDTDPPLPILSSTTAESTNSRPIPVTVSFRKPVSGFEITDIVATNVVVSGLGGTGANYSFNLTPSAQGLVTVYIKAGAVKDSGGIASSASTTLTRHFDSLSPVLSSLSALPTIVGFGKMVTLSFTVSESLQTSPTLTVNAHPSTLANHSGLNYSFSYLVQDVDYEGPATIVVTGADRAGNTGMMTNRTALQLDTVSPRCTIKSPLSPTSDNPLTFSITFSKAVIGFSSSDVTVVGGTRGTLKSYGDGKSYDIAVTPLVTSGEISCLIPTRAATDARGNYNLPSNTAAVRYEKDNVMARILRYLLGVGGESATGLDLNGDQRVTITDFMWRRKNQTIPAEAGTTN